MKNISILFLIQLISASIIYGQNSNISGLVTYKNQSNTLMKDSTVVILTRNDTVIAIDTVDSSGNYSFTDLPAGTYKVKATSNKRWGGVNAVDGLKISANFAGLITLTGLNLLAGDVNQSGGIPGNPDALAVIRRWAGQITTFAPAPDWYSLKYTISLISGQSIIQDIPMLCAGDVNGSYIPF